MASSHFDRGSQLDFVCRTRLRPETSESPARVLSRQVDLRGRYATVVVNLRSGVMLDPVLGSLELDAKA
jgi:hypothetical protein